jgi:hypothetical protein
MSIIYLVYTVITFTSGIILRYQNLAADILFLVMGSVLLVCDLLSEPFYVSRVTGTDVSLAPWCCLVPAAPPPNPHHHHRVLPHLNFPSLPDNFWHHKFPFFL